MTVETNEYKDPDILGFCAYCKDPVFADGDFVSNNGGYYHLFCYNQKNLYIDDFGENIAHDGK